MDRDSIEQAIEQLYRLYYQPVLRHLERLVRQHESKERTMSARRTEVKTPSSTQDRIATGLLLLAALGACYACIAAIGAATAASPATQQVEWWRVFGLLMFTGIFVLLAFWPRRYPGLWELVILNKAALTIVEALLIRNNATNAMSAAVADGILTVVLIVAYILRLPIFNGC
jgi:hypothetical protein